MRKHLQVLLPIVLLAAISFVSIQAGIIQAIIPAAAPTANKRGNSSIFQLGASTTPAAAGSLYCDDGTGLTTTVGCSAGNSALVNVKSSPYNALGNGVVRVDGQLGSPSYSFGCSVPCAPSGFVVEYSGVNAIPVDPGVFSGATGSGSPFTAPAVTTVAANDLLLTAYAWGGPTAGTLTPPGAAMQRELNNFVTNQYGSWIGDQVIVSPGLTSAQAATYTQSVSWDALSIALQPSGGTAPVFVAGAAATNAGGSSLTITRPAGTVQGNLDTVCIAYNNSTTLTKPAGLTLITQQSNAANTLRLACYQGIATALTTTNLHSASSTFTAGDVGKLACVANATVTGTDLCTTISAFVDANDVTLAAGSANGSITGSEFVYLSNDDVAIAAAAVAGCGTGIYFPPGLYGATAQISPCVTGNFAVVGAGGGLIDFYQNGGGANTWTNGKPQTAIFWATNSLSSGTAGLYLGFGVEQTDVHQQGQLMRNIFQVRDIGILAGIGLNYDGGGASATGIYSLSLNHVVLQNVFEGGFGQDGLNLNSNWSASALNSSFQNNGRYGIQLQTANGGQNILLETTWVQNNQNSGIFVPNSLGPYHPLSIQNSIIQWNNRATNNPAYELQIANGVAGNLILTGNWIEKAFANTLPFTAQTGMAAALIAGNTYAGGYTNVPALTSGGGGTGGAIQANSFDGAGTVKVGTTVTTNSIVLTFGIAYPAALPCTAQDVTNTLSIGVQCIVTGTTITLNGFAYATGLAANFTASDVISWQMPYGH